MRKKKEGDQSTQNPNKPPVILAAPPGIPQPDSSIQKSIYGYKRVSSSSRFGQHDLQSNQNESKPLPASRNSQTNEEIIQQTLKMFKRIKHDRKKSLGGNKQEGTLIQKSLNSSRSSEQSLSSSLLSSFSSDGTQINEDQHQIWDNTELKENGYFNLDELSSFQLFKLRIMTYPNMRQPQISNAKVVQTFLDLQQTSEHMATAKMTKKTKVNRTQNLIYLPCKEQATNDQIKQWQSDQTHVHLDISLSETFRQFSSFFETTVEAEKIKQRPQKFQRYNKRTLEPNKVRKRGTELIKKQFLQMVEQHQSQQQSSIQDLSLEQKSVNTGQKSIHSRLSLGGTNSQDSNLPSCDSFSQITQGFLSPAKPINSPADMISRQFQIRKLSASKQFNQMLSNGSPQSSLFSKELQAQNSPLKLTTQSSSTLNYLNTFAGNQMSNITLNNNNNTPNITLPNNNNNSPSLQSLSSPTKTQQYGRKLSQPILNIGKTESPSFHENSQHEVFPFAANIPSQKRASSYHIQEPQTQDASKMQFMNNPPPSLQAESRSTIEPLSRNRHKVSSFASDWQAIAVKPTIEPNFNRKISFSNLNVQTNDQPTISSKFGSEQQKNKFILTQTNEQQQYQPPSSPMKKHQINFQRHIPSLHLSKQSINNFLPKISLFNPVVTDLSRAAAITSSHFHLNASPAASHFNSNNSNNNMVNQGSSHIQGFFSCNNSNNNSPYNGPSNHPSSTFASAALMAQVNNHNSPFSLQNLKLDSSTADTNNGGASIFKLLQLKAQNNQISSQQEYPEGI